MNNVTRVNFAAKFKAPEPEDYEPVQRYFERLAQAVEEWVNEHYPATKEQGD